MLSLRNWNLLETEQRKEILAHLMPFALPEDIDKLSGEFHHNLTYSSSNEAEVQGEQMRKILEALYDTGLNTIKVVSYVQI